MTAGNSSFQVGIDFESVLKAISKQIYETPYAFIRENVQNAVDAIRIQSLRDEADLTTGRYCVDVTIEGQIIQVRDNGIGMTEADLQNYFWTIGASGKRGKEALEAGCVGMFGIGGFANFGVCNMLEVISQTEDTAIGTRTRLSEEDISAAGAAIPSVTVANSDAAGPRGTVVIGRMRDAPNVNDLKVYLKDFVRYVPVEVRFNGEPISRQRFTDVEDRDNLTSVGDERSIWQDGEISVTGRLFEDRGHTLVAEITGLVLNDRPIGMTGQLRFENGPIDVFKRGFKLCATQIPSTIGISGRLDCDQFVPTAGRDSMDAGTTRLLSRIGTLLETIAIDAVLVSPERIAQHTRIFRLILKRGLVAKMDNVVVRLADGDELPLRDVRRRADEGRISVFFGTTQKQALNQVMQARGHIVVILSSDGHRRQAEKLYLEKFCGAKPFDGMIDCTEVYASLTRFERVFLSELESNISRSYEIRNFRLIAGRLTEDIPTYVKEYAGNKPIDIFVDVRHTEVIKLQGLGYSQLLYSLISTFCHVYLGPSLKVWSPRFFGDGALNLELLAKRRSELWILLKDDIGVIRKGGQRQLVTQKDVQVVRIGGEQPETESAAEQKPRLLRIIDDDQRTELEGYYIRLTDTAFKAYGDLLPECDSHGVVWVGNRMTFVASDDVSAQFQYQIVLDEIVAAEVGGVLRAEGVFELDRPLQGMFDGVYFPIPGPLERYLVPAGDEQIRLDLHCEWIDMRTAKLWEAEENRPSNGANLT